MPEMQQPNIVGNFLQQYYGAQDRVQAQAADQMQQQRQQTADKRASVQFDWQKQDHDLQAKAAQADAVARDALSADTPQKWEQMRAAHPQSDMIPDWSQRESVINRAKSVSQIINDKLAQQKFGLDERQTNAQIGLIGAQTDSARAQAEYTRSGKGLAGGKPLTSPMNKEFGALGDQFSQVKNLAASFNPAYASRGVFGFGADAMNAKDRTFGGSDAATWWQGYDRYKNVVRNELFGASLTPGEKASFESADVTPGMDEKTIKDNLAIQQRIVEGSLNRRARSAASQGFNQDAIMELTGLGGSGNAPPPAGAGGPPPVVTTKAQFDALPSGTIYVESDGNRYRKP